MDLEPALPKPLTGKILNRIKDIEEKITNYNSAIKEAQDLMRSLEDYVRDSLTKCDKDFEPIVVYSYAPFAGCTSWSPEIFLYFPRIFYIGNREFVVSDLDSFGLISQSSILSEELPFDGEKLLDLCDDLSNELGVKVGFRETGVTLS